jgi:hypothetical protein
VTGADLTIKNLGTAVASFSIPDFENNGTLVCQQSLAWNYELMAYSDVLYLPPTPPNRVEIQADGSGIPPGIQRSIYNAPNSGGVGILHSAGELFAVLNPDGVGIFKINLPPQWIGVELFFKFLSFNEFGSAVQTGEGVTAYSYTPTGVPYA